MNPSNPVSQIMTTYLIVAKPDDSLHEIKNVFNKNGFHHLPIVDEGESLVGIISREDLLKTTYALSLNTYGKTFSENTYKTLKAKEIMTQYPLHLDPEDTIGLAADIFLANKFHALPIVDDGKLVGLITTHDIIKYSYTSPLEIVVKEER